MLVYTYTPIKLHDLVLAPLINRETNSKISKIHQQVDESHIRKVHPQNGRSVAGRELKCQQEAPISRKTTQPMLRKGRRRSPGLRRWT